MESYDYIHLGENNNMKLRKIKFIKFIIFMIFIIWFTIGIMKNYQFYGIMEWVVVILTMLVIYFIIWIFFSYVEKRSCRNQNNKCEVLKNDSYMKNASQQQKIDLPPQYVESKTGLSRIDGLPIADEEIPFLIQRGYEKALKTMTESCNPKFHRTNYEEELSFKFMMKYAKQLQAKTDIFLALYRKAYGINDLTEKINVLNKAIEAFENAKKFAYSKGKGGTIYFQDMWEHLHNSQNPCYSYLDLITNSINSAKRKRDIILPSIINAIRSNEGILQKNLYCTLPDIDKIDIQNTLRELERDSKITRIKKGNSYELYLNEIINNKYFKEPK